MQKLGETINLSDILRKIQSGELTIPSMSKDEKLEADCRLYNSTAGKLKGYHCASCKNRGHTAVIKPTELGKYIALRPCTCLETRGSLKRIEASGLNSVLDEYTFESYKTGHEWQKKLKDSAMNFVKDFKGKWLYFGGQVGCGKTHLCTAVVGKLLKQGLSARYMMWRDEIVSLKTRINTEEYGETLNKFKQIPVLYIDDLFKTAQGGHPSPADIGVAFELINFRYCNKEFTTVISSEFYLDDICGFDEGLGGRIKQRSRDYTLAVGRDRDKDYRLQ